MNKLLKYLKNKIKTPKYLSIDKSFKISALDKIKIKKNLLSGYY